MGLLEHIKTSFYQKDDFLANIVSGLTNFYKNEIPIYVLPVLSFSMKVNSI